MGPRQPLEPPTRLRAEVGQTRSKQMPKLKTNRGAAKRFRRTGKGGYKRSQSYLNHILTKKSTKRKRHLRSTLQVAEADVKAVRKLLPYS